MSLEAGEPEGEGDARRSTRSETGGYQEQVITTLTYSLLSSTLSVVNKYTLDTFPFPAFVLAVQLTSTAAVIYVGRVVRLVNLSLVSRKIVLGFVPLTMSFFALLASRLLLMATSPFNVFLICKSLTPFFVSLSETLYFGTSWPTLQSFVAMLGMAIGSVLYTRYDVQVSATCLTYAVFFILCSVFEGVVAKQTIQKFTLNQNTRTLLMNALACPIAIIWALCMETKALTEIKLNSTLSLGISCVLGLGMGMATMHMRTIFSATYVSVVGVCNKFVSLVLANLVLSGSHSLQSTLSTAFVLLCGSFYNGNSASSTVRTRNCVPVLLLVVISPLGAWNLRTRVHINATTLPALVSDHSHKTCQTAADNCEGPFLWDTSTHREGFGSNLLNWRIVSLQLSEILRFSWIPSEFINSHDRADISTFLGLSSPNCNFGLIKEQVTNGSLFVANITDILNTTGTTSTSGTCSTSDGTCTTSTNVSISTFRHLKSLNCSVYKAMAESVNRQIYRQHVFKYDEPDRIERSQLYSHLHRCMVEIHGQQLKRDAASYTSTPSFVRSSYLCARNRRLAASGRLKKSNEYRISLYFRWGDVRGDLKNVKTYNKRTGAVPFGTLTRYTEQIQNIVSHVLQTRTDRFQTLGGHIENRTVFFFSEGTESEFATFFSKDLLNITSFQIGGSWMDAVDYMTQSNIILVGTKSETFISAIGKLCDYCKVIDVRGGI
ncbi:unnamed product [Ostreococcus tauri]|uniref:Unnamed product n=1 Tax=Ostreococcus tauri TaxID=70448 RepID=A0A096PAI5_OSTTA|nr:unnamed product [Ostreococcus tauri]CEG01918.1 unnamed product [Ostreococcus tauri]|eukprot:XP_022841248.1 unnamed product [Ostreococcus tauri]